MEAGNTRRKTDCSRIKEGIMENHEQFIEFDQYCKTCQHEKLAETDSPCDECLEHPVNTDSNIPFCYERRS